MTPGAFLAGTCAAFGGDAVPFLPLVEALRGLPDDVARERPDEVPVL